MSNEVEEDFIKIVDMVYECYNDIDKLEDVANELNYLKDYVVRRLQNYEDNYERISESKMYGVQKGSENVKTIKEIWCWVRDMEEIKDQIETDDKQYNILLKNYCKLEKQMKQLEEDMQIKEKAFERLKKNNKKLKDEIKALKN